MTKREKIMVSSLVIILAVTAFLWFYLFPSLNDLDRVRQDVAQQRILNDAGQLHTMRTTQLRNELFGAVTHEGEPAEGSLLYLHAQTMTNVIDDFESTFIMRFIEQLINPRVASDTSVNISFQNSRVVEGLEVHPSVVTFTVANRVVLLDILESFYHFPVENRIVNYTVQSRVSDQGIATAELQVALNVEFITQRS